MRCSDTGADDRDHLLLLHYDEPVLGKTRHALIRTDDANKTFRAAYGPRAAQFNSVIVRRAYALGLQPKVGKVWQFASEAEYVQVRMQGLAAQCGICIAERAAAQQDEHLAELLEESVARARQRTLPLRGKS